MHAGNVIQNTGAQRLHERTEALRAGVSTRKLHLYVVKNSGSSEKELQLKCACRRESAFRAFYFVAFCAFWNLDTTQVS